MKKLILLLLSFMIANIAFSEDYLLSTSNNSILINATRGQKAYIDYYGTRIDKSEIPSIRATRANMHQESYPCFGLACSEQKALSVTLPDGNMSLDLTVENVSTKETQEGTVLEITLQDKIYSFCVKQYFKAYKGTDIISTLTELINNCKKPVYLDKFESGILSFHRGDNWLTHFHGAWGAENMLEEEALTSGDKIIGNKVGIRNTQTNNPSFMLSMDGRPQENSGIVVGGILAWSGNFRLLFHVNNSEIMAVAGMNPENSRYKLKKNEQLTTPEFAYSYSTVGKGGISRAFHKWARKYKLKHGDQERRILLNSWEGVYLKVNETKMNQMMHDISEMGGELFVMDDGWFGNKYPRNTDSTSLGDWEVCHKKLPHGIEGLLQTAEKNNIKFGIWIEPEMTNTKSELYKKHPDWILSIDNRPLSKGRGGTEVMLDLTNPEVQDFVFGIVDNLLTKYPRIAYIKWDANCEIMDYGSHYLPKDEQSHLYIDYQKGLIKTLKRIRQKYPDVTLQACASGGGRVNYGLLPYFDEFWTSDNTDAYQRIFIQWGVSNFYPAIAMAAHVSANKNHQTRRITPLKFRFDVAMTGRLGLEIQPKDMNQKEKDFAKRAIRTYKQIRPIIQFGDLYRLISPYDNKNIASLLYTTEDKNEAVFFVYKMKHLINEIIPTVRLDGLDSNKKYKLTELNPLNSKNPYIIKSAISGKILKEQGIRVPLKKEYSSMVLKLEAVK